jgi:hypothetical protein
MNQTQTDQPQSNTNKSNAYALTVDILTFPLFVLSVILHTLGEIVLLPAMFFIRLPYNPQLKDFFNLGREPEDTTKAQELKKQGQI